MAMTFTTRPNAYGTSLAARLVFAVTTLPQSLADRREINKTAKSLRKLSSRQLEDIGLTYGDVDRMVR